MFYRKNRDGSKNRCDWNVKKHDSRAGVDEDAATISAYQFLK